MRCDNNTLLKKIGLSAIDKNVEIDFRLRKDLPDCRKINTRNFVNISGTYTYNNYKKPVNRFECDRKGCVTTGLLMMTAIDETVDFRAMYDATEFANGVVTFYVFPGAGVTYPITLNFTISDADTFTNADVYTRTLTADMVTSDGFIPVQITLAATPSNVEGTGWEPKATGAYIRLSANQIVGYSSISIYDTPDDFDLLETVTMSCLTTVGGTFGLELVTQQCQEARYNDDVQQLEFPVTGTQITPNFMNLFPMIRKGNSEVGYKMTTATRTIGADGKITLADVNQDVCGYITVQSADRCDVGTYTHSSSIDAAELDDGHFIVVKNADGTTDVVFNTSQAGVEVLVRYPKKVSIKERVANVNNLNSSQLSATIPFGDNMLLVFDKVFVTSFPITWTNEENNFAFTLAIGRDEEGNFMRVFEIEE